MAEIDVDASRSPSQLDRMMADALRPAILLNKMVRPGDSGARGCWRGGKPTSPHEIEWPGFVSKGQKLAPTHFVAQISLAELSRKGGVPPLSTQGSFFFFTPNLADMYGFPDESAKVNYVTKDVSAKTTRHMPSVPAFSTLPAHEGWAFVYRETPRTGFTRWPVDFLIFWIACQDLLSQQFDKAYALMEN
ncbi:MAG: DUF1963 domain-containing protein [Paracoccaceae bacterium]